jgi:glycosyltransferase involved in cell wall biosynthesis
LQFLEEALFSAVNQTVPVKVILHDDGCDDLPKLEKILSRFGGAVEYRRATGRHGLFENMNRCIWESPTPWVSVLHDDDRLEPNFVEKILEVAPEVDACALFCGGTTYIDREGHPFFVKSPVLGQRWATITPERLAVENQFAFPGQLIHVPTAKAVGGFPEKSVYTGDWELWFKLTLAGGAVQLGSNLSQYRSHDSTDRGTTAANRTGRKIPCCAAQVKRNLARLTPPSSRQPFQRQEWIRIYGPQYRDILPYAWSMPAWLLRYNRRILMKAPPSTRITKLLRGIAATLGNPGLRFAGLLSLAAWKMGLAQRQRF